nr:hypothetical protein CFP56_25732 [Quercus suber]
MINSWCQTRIASRRPLRSRKPSLDGMELERFIHRGSGEHAANLRPGTAATIQRHSLDSCRTAAAGRPVLFVSTSFSHFFKLIHARCKGGTSRTQILFSDRIDSDCMRSKSAFRACIDRIVRPSHVRTARDISPACLTVVDGRHSDCLQVCGTAKCDRDLELMSCPKLPEIHAVISVRGEMSSRLRSARNDFSRSSACQRQQFFGHCPSEIA